jgi:hypothetical protein
LFFRRTRKHGGTKRRARHCARTNGGQGSRRKIHIGIDEQTLEIRAAAFTTRPAIIRSSVDFPQPDGPTSATNSPSATSKLTPCITWLIP